MVFLNAKDMPHTLIAIAAIQRTMPQLRQLPRPMGTVIGPLLSTSCRSVLNRLVFSLFATLLAVSVSYADSGKTPQNAGASTKSSELGALVLSHLGDYDEFPTGVPAHIEVRDDAVRKSSSGETVFPARISFQGVANSYCRLVVVSPSGDSALLVPVPSGYDNDQCQSVRLIAAVDLNNDLANDFVLGVRFPSNRYATIVDELRVYLSQKESATEFCLAGNLTHVSVERAVVDLVRAEIRRLGPSALECAN